MKTGIIQVETDAYEYMGLKRGLHIVADHNFEEGLATAYFSFQGRQWTLYDQQFSIASEMKASTVTTACIDGPIKSDGGSSTYYDLPVSEWLLYTLNERQKEGKCYIKTEEIIADLLGDSFDYGNLFKSMVRCKGLQDGTGGKAGNSVEYECNKMIYSVNKIKEKK